MAKGTAVCTFCLQNSVMEPESVLTYNNAFLWKSISLHDYKKGETKFNVQMNI